MISSKKYKTLTRIHQLKMAEHANMRHSATAG